LQKLLVLVPLELSRILYNKVESAAVQSPQLRVCFCGDCCRARCII
jgi:hypothetical protein